MRKYSRTVFTIFLCWFGTGCTPVMPPKAANPPAVPKKSVADNPLVMEALPDTEAILKDLLAGVYDDDPSLSPVARKVKGFQSWAFETLDPNPDLPQSVNFSGILKGPKGEAEFTALMVKQQNGKWMIGTFSGPNAR